MIGTGRRMGLALLAIEMWLESLNRTAEGYLIAAERFLDVIYECAHITPKKLHGSDREASRPCLQHSTFIGGRSECTNVDQATDVDRNHSTS